MRAATFGISCCFVTEAICQDVIGAISKSFYTDGCLRSCCVNPSWATTESNRVGEITLDVEAPGLPAEKLETFTRVIEHCTVHNTLRHPPEVRIRLTSKQTAAA
jgi:hypothetical protein